MMTVLRHIYGHNKALAFYEKPADNWKGKPIKHAARLEQCRMGTSLPTH